MRRKGSGFLKLVFAAVGGLALWEIFKPSKASAGTPPDTGPVKPPYPTSQSVSGLVPSTQYIVEFYTPPDYTTDQVVSAFANAGFSEIYPSTPLSQMSSLRWQVTARWVSPADHTTFIGPFNSLIYRPAVEPPAAA
jgi:hypothetical protein